MSKNVTKWPDDIELDDVLLNRVSAKEYDEWVETLDPLDKDEMKIYKTQRRLIRNRESAARSRKRKAEELEHLREENERLRDEVDRLRRIIGQ